jgi:hypothetical protein
MKRLKLLLLVLMGAIATHGQLSQIKILNFTVKNQLPASVDNWLSQPGALLLTAQKAPTVQLRGAKLVLQIRSGGAIYCGTNVTTARDVEAFEVRSFSTAELVNYLGQCKDLKEGTYTICAQFFNIDRIAISNEMCRDFTVVGQKDTEYAPPTLITPEDGKKYSEAELSRPLNFRWTPLVPKPQQPVTYRLRVWQLMQGQNSTQAMRTNQPIVTKDVDNITQAVVNNIYTGPCKPPYLCDFVWQVQALTREGKPIGNNEGKSEPYRFGIQEAGSAKPPTLIAPTDNKSFSSAEAGQPIAFRWTPLVPKPQQPVTYRLRVWQLMQGQNSTQVMRTNKPIVTKDVADITEATVSGIYTGPCKPPYLCDFVWQVQALDREGKPVGDNEGKSDAFKFGIQEAGSAKPPTLVAPVDKKSFSPAEAGQPISFRWTPLVPKPQEPVTYRLRVWQLMQGQNSTQAMRTNKPIVTKDVADITEATVSGIYTGPCKPPYLCDFVWNVQALDRQGKPIGENEGTSQTWAFMVTQYIIQLDSIKVNCTAKPGVYSFSYTITNPNVGPATLNLFTVTSSVPAGASIASFAPPIGTPIPAGSQLTITGTINGAPNLSNICIGAEIRDVGNTFWKASKDTCVNVVPCKCNACDSVKIDPQPKGEVQADANGNLVQNVNLSVSPKLVKSIKAELVYFEYKPQSDDCMLCNKDSKTFGNFIAATANNNPLGIPYPHTAEWNSGNPNGQNINNVPLQFTISMPPTVKCCAAEVKWCIRYVITFADCTVCNKLVCYSYNKKCDCK